MSNIHILIDKYVENAINHGDATLSGDSKVANNSYAAMVENLKQIYELDSKGDLFLGLLKHENESVRLWSATHALFINNKAALKTIKKIAKGTSIFSFSASIVADEWNKGTLESPL